MVIKSSLAFLDIISYENLSELVFTISPKLYYEASKNYQKYKETDYRKKAMLKKRMQAEKEVNLKKISRFLNEFVTIGSEIQLFHMYSKSYVKATREKNSRSNQLFNLILAKQPSSGMHFKIKINPYYSFKKDGEKISYDDQFFFENLKLESRIVYKEVPFGKEAKNQINKDLDRDIGKFKRGGNVQEEIKLEYPFVMENQTVFNILEAGHRKDDINNFKAFFLSSPENKEEKSGDSSGFSTNNHENFPLNNNIPKSPNNATNFPSNSTNFPSNFSNSSVFPNNSLKTIHWGDYIRINHVRRGDKSQGVLYSEHNVTGQCPKAYFYLQEQTVKNSFEKDSASSIFQILSLDEELMGKAIEIDIERFGFSILLRHYLTGRYLKIENSCYLSEKLENIIQKNPGISKALIKKIGFKWKKTTVLSQGKDSPSFKPSHLPEIKELGFTEEKTEISKEKAPVFPESPLKDFFEKSEILLSIASKDGGFLNNSHCFSLMGKQSENFLIIAEEEAVNEGRYTLISEENSVFEAKNFLSSECFQRTFFNMNPLDRKLFSLGISSEDADFFFFSSVSNEEITDILTISSRIFPFISLSSNFTLANRQEILNIADISLEKLCFWLCESKEKQLNLIKTKPFPNRQKLLRETGFIDILIKILFELFDRRLLMNSSKNVQFSLLATNLIFLLNLANLGNYANSIYIFQWYSLFKMVITDESTTNGLKLDDLLIQLFDETKLNVSYRGDLLILIPSILFGNYNRNALNLVIAFCTYNEFLQKEDFEDIVKTVLESEGNRDKIFRPFTLIHKELSQQKRLVLNVEKTKEIEINEGNFEKNSVFLYVSKLLVLAIELSKGNPALVVPFYEELYPFDVCLEVLKVRKINANFKALFINLFIESYLAFDFRYSMMQNFPNNVKFKGNMFKKQSQIDGKIKQNNLNLMIKYFNENFLWERKENETKRENSKMINLKSKFIELLWAFLKSFSK